MKIIKNSSIGWMLTNDFAGVENPGQVDIMLQLSFQGTKSGSTLSRGGEAEI